MSVFMAESVCSACGLYDGKLVRHALLDDVPVCEGCWGKYHSGEFIIDGSGNEIYCRWCGEGNGTLCLCDSCPKAFCSECIKRNFGFAELKRIEAISERWNCFLCSPLPLEDLVEKKGWGTAKTKRSRMNARPYLISNDISRGREKFEIPVFNEVDDAPAPLDFVYVNKHVSGEGVSISNNPSFTSCCTCTDNCKDPAKCECAQLMGGFAYDINGILIAESAAGIYECNLRCSCHLNRCKNRVVGSGPQLKLEVFRCSDPRKGWGVRCAVDILPGTYVADYIGEVMQEAHAETRGISRGDEYLFQLDNWGRSQACQKLSELGMKKGLLAIPKELNTDTCALSSDKDEVASIIGREMADILEAKGALARAVQLGKQRESGDTQAGIGAILGGEGIKPGDLSHSQSPLRRRKATTGLDKRKKSAGSVAASSSNINSSSSTSSSSSSSGSSSGNLNGKSTAKQTGHSERNMEIGTGKVGACGGSGTSNATGGATSKLTWSEANMEVRLAAWRNAVSILTDRAVLETENNFETFAIDARWFGSIGRFLNHSCDPNLDIVTVFVDSHDVRIPRVAFFSNGYIPAKTELVYDYGYYPGNVEGKHRKCLCGAAQCRKVLY